MSLLRKLHKWTAITFALLLLIQSSTGLILANKEALLPVFNPEAVIMPSAKRASIDDIFANISAAQPTASIDRLIYSKDAGSVIIARTRLQDRTMTIMLVDPADGSILSQGSIWRYPTQAAERVHVSLLFGTPGQVVLLIEGIVLAFLAGSGLYLWWPGKRRIGKVLKIRFSGPSARLVRDLHVTPGAVMALLLLITGTSGALVLSEPLIKPLIGRFVPVLPEINPQLPDIPADTAYKLSAHEAASLIKTRFPDGRMRQLRVLAHGRLIGAVMVAENSANPRAHHIAGVDRATGQLSVYADGNHLPAGEAVLSWLLPLHTGELYGPVRKIMLSITAVTLMLMIITGLTMWIRNSRVRRRKKLTKLSRAV